MNNAAKAVTDKRSLIAEALLAGENIDQIREQLITSGASPASADYELRRAEKDPLFQTIAVLQRRIAKRDWTLGIHGRLANTRAGGLSIPRVDRITSAEFFEHFYAANRPVVLTSLVDHWPALTKWSLDYLAERVGDATVELQAERSAADDYELAKDRHKRTSSMREVINAIRNEDESNDFYVTAYNDTTNKQTLAPLWEDVGDLSILQPSGGLDGFLWFGPKGTLTPFHHDLTNNLLVQVLGRKRVHMVPSWEVGRMRNSIHCFSGRSPAEWPNGENLPPLVECEIGPGDALFLPIGWWHHVEALDVSISVSFTNFAADNDFYIDYPADTRF
jgi:ribosomal protein L16 Arg81 hydroxylase